MFVRPKIINKMCNAASTCTRGVLHTSAEVYARADALRIYCNLLCLAKLNDKYVLDTSNFLRYVIGSITASAQLKEGVLEPPPPPLPATPLHMAEEEVNLMIHVMSNLIQIGIST